MPLPQLEYETAERQTLDEILEWYHGVSEAILAQRASVLRAIQTGSVVSLRFMGLTEADVEAYHDVQQRELDRLALLNLVASAEATITVNCIDRVKAKHKDPLSRAYQQWYKKLAPAKQLRPDFDVGGILDVLKQAQVMDNNIVGRYRECLHARHWVGHGRRWDKPVAVDRLDAEDVYDRAKALLAALPQ